MSIERSVSSFILTNDLVSIQIIIINFIAQFLEKIHDFAAGEAPVRALFTVDVGKLASIGAAARRHFDSIYAYKCRWPSLAASLQALCILKEERQISAQLPFRKEINKLILQDFF